jgi:glucokinase
MGKKKIEAVLAVDAGGTYYKSALIDGRGSIIPGTFHEKPSHSDGDKETIIHAFSEMLTGMVQKAIEKKLTIKKAVFGFPGPFDYNRGACITHHKFGAVYNIPLKPIAEDLIASLTNYTVPVAYHHDMHAYALGAYLYDAGAGWSRVFCIAIGTGLGGGFVNDGVVDMLPDRKAKFPIFKQPYKEGILEDIVSNRGLAEEYKRKTGFKGEIDAWLLQQKADGGDKIAIEVYQNMGTILGNELKPLFRVLEPDCLVLGGQISKAYHVFGPALEKNVKDIKSIKHISPLRDFKYVAVRGTAALPLPVEPVSKLQF